MASDINGAARHTPGEWRVDPEEPIVRGAGPNKLIADCRVSNRTSYNQRTDEENFANAHMIAAAPELLEAIEDMLTTAAENGFDTWPGDAGREFVGACNRARAAIAKARQGGG